MSFGVFVGESNVPLKKQNQVGPLWRTLLFSCLQQGPKSLCFLDLPYYKTHKIFNKSKIDTYELSISEGGDERALRGRHRLHRGGGVLHPNVLL